jgi:hypothetical protein
MFYHMVLTKHNVPGPGTPVQTYTRPRAGTNMYSGTNTIFFFLFVTGHKLFECYLSPIGGLFHEMECFT